MNIAELCKGLVAGKPVSADSITAIRNAFIQLQTPVSPFGQVSVSLADSTAVYPQRDGGKSCKVVELIVPLVHAGLRVSATIYARSKQTGDGVEVSYEASFPRDVKALSDDAKDAFLAHCETAASQWSGWAGARDAAFARLTGIGLAKPATEIPQLARPRLVKTTKDVAAPTTAAPTAVNAPAPA